MWNRRVSLLLCFASPLLLADQVTFKNGDRLSGTVVKCDMKELVFKTEFAGEVKASWDAVTLLSTSSTVYVGIKGSGVSSGTLTLGADTAEVKTTSAGLVTAARSTIESIRSKDEQTAYDTQIERYRNPRLLDLWAGFVDLGVSKTGGNAITTNVATTAQATRTTSRDKIGVNFTSVYASNKTKGVALTTANAIRGGIGYDLNLTPRVFAFGSTTMEYDEFQGLDLRFAPSGGLGYKAWKSDRGFFSLNGGVTLNREFFASGVKRTSGEALLAEETVFKPSARTTFRQKLSFYPNMTRRGEYRGEFDASLVTTLWKWLGWQFSFSDRLLSNPVAGRKRNDMLFTTGLRLTFAR